MTQFTQGIKKMMGGRERVGESGDRENLNIKRKKGKSERKRKERAER